MTADTGGRTVSEASEGVRPPREAPLRSLLRRLFGRLRAEEARDTVWALVDQGATLFASTLSFLLLGRSLGAVGYGAFVGLYSLIGPFVALGQSGVYLSTMDHIARAGEDPGEVGRSCMSITLVNGALWVPALSAASLLWIKGLTPVAVVFLVGTEFCLNALFTQSVGIVQVIQGFPAAARLRIAQALLRIVPLAILAASGRLTLTTLALSQAATTTAMMLVAVARTSRIAGVTIVPGAIRWRHLRSVLLYGVQVGCGNVQADGDKFALNAAHHQADAGRYGAASRIMLFALLPLYAMVNATHVTFLKTGGDPNDQLRRAFRSSVVAMAYGVPAALCLFLAAPLAPLILTRDFSETTRILQWLAPLVILRGQSSFPMNGLMGLGRNALRTKLVLANAALSVILYVTLIPKYSWRGALVATLITELTISIAAWLALYRFERNRRLGESSVCIEGT